MRALQQAPETLEDGRRHAGAFEVEHGPALVEQTHDHRLAELHGHGRDADVDVAVAHADVEAAILRQSLLGDVEAGHDLQAHDQRRGDAVLLHDLLVEHTVDPLANPHQALVRLDVDVRGLHLHGVFEQGLEQAHDRRVGVALGTEARKVEVAFLQLTFKLAGDRGDLAGAPIDLVEHRQQLALAHHRRVNALSEQALHLVLGEQVEGVGHANQQAVALPRQDDDAEAPRHGLGQALGQVVVELVMLEFDERDLQLLGQRLEQAAFVDEAEIDDRAAELGAGALLLLQRQLQLRVGDEAGLDQQVADAHLALAEVERRHGISPETAASAARRSSA